jgi:hypothetical protein
LAKDDLCGPNSEYCCGHVSCIGLCSQSSNGQWCCHARGGVQQC